MFLLNSRLGLLTAAPGGAVARAPGAPLIPKLRGCFAEFLNVVSPAHLGLLDPSTCVGLRYGLHARDRSRFSRRAGLGAFAADLSAAPPCGTPVQ